MNGLGRFFREVLKYQLKITGFEKKTTIQDEKYTRTHQFYCSTIKFQYFMLLLVLIYQILYNEKNEILGLFLLIVIFVSFLVQFVTSILLKIMEKCLMKKEE